jgi:hypothetical protein
MKTLLPLLVSFGLLLTPAAARADDDLPMGRVERVAQRLERAQGGKRSSFELTAQLGTRVEGGAFRDVVGFLFATVPFDRIAAQPRAVAAAPAPEPAPAADDKPNIQPLFTAEEVRSLVAAAVRAAGLDKDDKRLDDMASRARAAAALPELRIRVARISDDSQSLAPTEYDPLRVTADARVTLWLEARATWRLDRLLFADEEVPIQREKRTLAAERLKITERVAALLAQWQKAKEDEKDPEGTEMQRVHAALRALEAETTLDLLSGGWVSARKKATKAPEPKPAPKPAAPNAGDKPQTL